MAGAAWGRIRQFQAMDVGRVSHAHERHTGLGATGQQRCLRRSALCGDVIANRIGNAGFITRDETAKRIEQSLLGGGGLYGRGRWYGRGSRANHILGVRS